MYCSHCGKKVTDTMLFCPFCGDPIVIPDQDEPSESAPVEPSAASGTPERAEADAVSVEAYVPLSEADAAAEQATDADGETSVEAAPELNDAAAELLDWSRSRREYADDDVWARRDGPAEPFEPLDLDETTEDASGDWRGEIVRRKDAAAPQKRAPDMSAGVEPVRLDGVAPKLEAGADRAKKDAGTGRKPTRKSANTLVPPKPMDPKDIFMDGDDEYDAADAFDRYDAPTFEDSGYVYEDEGEDSFFMRHLRGIVGLAMFVILILMFVIYAFSSAGQLTLARINLAWSTGAYSQLGDESYEDGQYAQAGQFYERALQRDPDNYAFASAAVMAYLEAEDNDKAAAMLKRCAQIDPTKLDPYLYLLNLYPDAAQRPWDVTQLLQQGYQATGDDRLKVTG